MASSMMSTAAVASVNRASMVAPFTGVKSTAAFPVTRKENDIASLASNGGRVQCMQLSFRVLSYLPDLSPDQLAKEVDYLLGMGWIPCLEFELEHGFAYREHHRSPGYYDGRYWTMWKLRCNDSSQVLKELEEAKKAYPTSPQATKFDELSMLGFDC